MSLEWCSVKPNVWEAGPVNGYLYRIFTWDGGCRIYQLGQRQAVIGFKRSQWCETRRAAQQVAEEWEAAAELRARGMTRRPATDTVKTEQ
jgi:hypothetical protein